MPTATLGADYVATWFASGVPSAERLGARIEVPVTRAIVSYWRPAVYDAATDTWTVVLESPVAAGSYLLVWRTGDPEPPAYESMVPLTVE